MAKTYAEALAEIKAQYGIASDLIDKKLERLITASDGAPLAGDILALIQSQITPANVGFRLGEVASELASLIKSGKSVPKKNRSALA